MSQQETGEMDGRKVALWYMINVILNLFFPIKAFHKSEILFESHDIAAILVIKTTSLCWQYA